jgi:tetratricopeptide (TPR) repeat protein
MRRGLLAAIVLASLLLAAGMQQRYDASHDYFSERNAFVSLPSGRTIKTLSFGFHSLAADLLFIWSIQFYSTYHIRNRFDFLERVYEAITDITPRYRDPYIVGALIMVHEAKDVPMALRLLDKGSRHNPEQWLFDQEAGFYSYKYLKDYDRAEKYYERAAANPDAPSFTRRMKAHLVYLRDDPRVSYQMWLDIYRNARDVLERDSALNHLYQIKAEIDTAILAGKIAEYRARNRRPPRALSELVDAGLVASLPRDFNGNEYVYDPLAGTVQAQRIFKWKRR